MKVILTQDVPKLGSFGQSVTVKDGYARNFLIPNGLAMVFSPENLKVVEVELKKKEIEVKRNKEEALELAKKLEGVSCTIAVKVIDDDRLFGSVTAEVIQKAYEAEGINIDKKYIRLEEPIKKLGVYQIPVKLHPEVEINCKIWIVKE